MKTAHPSILIGFWQKCKRQYQPRQNGSGCGAQGFSHVEPHSLEEACNCFGKAASLIEKRILNWAPPWHGSRQEPHGVFGRCAGNRRPYLFSLLYQMERTTASLPKWDATRVGYDACNTSVLSVLMGFGWWFHLSTSPCIDRWSGGRRLLREYTGDPNRHRYRLHCAFAGGLFSTRCGHSRWW